MAVAGGASSSIQLSIEHNTLQERAKMHRMAESMIDDIDMAVEKLLNGERVTLKLLGMNLHNVRAILQEQGVEIDPLSCIRAWSQKE